MVMRLLLIEDDPVMGEALQLRLELDGLDVRWCRRLHEARSVLPHGWDIVVSDVRLPDGLTTDWFLQLDEEQRRESAWFFLTGYGSVEHAVLATRAGARAYLTKPFDVEGLVHQIRLVMADADQACVLGPSAPMREIERVLRRVALQPVAVLITGESGVGKEVVAQRLHQLDPHRHDKPFVAVNCAAIPETMMEAEFFGYERGAFTGAQRQHRGFFEQADGGTLFLDEVAELTPTLQAKLLRALQEKSFYRLGAEYPSKSDFRVVCATNRNLHELTRDGLFREDLYYRLAVVRLHIPPLRERPEDIPWLANRLLHALAQLQNRPLAISADLMQWLASQPWRGNVRELKAFLEREAALSEHGLLDLAARTSPPLRSVLAPQESGGDETFPACPPHTPLHQVVALVERHHILRALRSAGGNISRAALMLEISRKTLWEKMRRYGILRNADESCARD